MVSLEVKVEAERLYKSLKRTNMFPEIELYSIAEKTLEINELKKEKKAIILAHSYQRPEIIYGVADFVGDSYGLSKRAQEVKDAETILFAGVVFMAETAKILNPSKKVVVPSREAGCSLADSITAKDVRGLKAEYPGLPVVCYINTYADVKAESDIVCTSANAERIVTRLPDHEIIFIPDKYMAQNLANSTGKLLVPWDGECIVHNQFGPDDIDTIKKQYPDTKILAHTECTADVVGKADMAGGTGDMFRYIKGSPARTFFMITECGMTDRAKVEFPDKEFVGTCILCPYMKKNNLDNIIQALKEPRGEQMIDVPEDVRVRAEKAINRMFEFD